jgi:hypothetical protein
MSEKQLGQKVTPLYGIISASGKQWTVEYQVELLPDGSGLVSHGVTGYGEFPRDKYPNIPVIDYRKATSDQIGRSLGSKYSIRPREENPVIYTGTLEGFLDFIRSIGIPVIT